MVNYPDCMLSCSESINDSSKFPSKNCENLHSERTEVVARANYGSARVQWLPKMVYGHIFGRKANNL